MCIRFRAWGFAALDARLLSATGTIFDRLVAVLARVMGDTRLQAESGLVGGLAVSSSGQLTALSDASSGMVHLWSDRPVRAGLSKCAYVNVYDH
jgi:hypothetical protein